MNSVESKFIENARRAIRFVDAKLQGGKEPSYTDVQEVLIKTQAVEQEVAGVVKAQTRKYSRKVIGHREVDYLEIIDYCEERVDEIAARQ